MLDDCKKKKIKLVHNLAKPIIFLSLNTRKFALKNVRNIARQN